MCILFVANGIREDYPLIVAANRDEFFARPSREAHFWEDHPSVLAGRDEQAGGSWLGINREGRFAAVTNFRIPSKHSNSAASRGELISRFLTGEESPGHYRENVERQYAAYNPFNLVVGDASKLYVFSSEAPGFRPLEAGCHPISNGPPDDHWPKMSRGTAALRVYLEQAPEVDPSYLAGLLRDSTRAPQHELPDTGIGEAGEHALSSIFIDTLDLGGGQYGTRTSTVLLFNHQEIHFYEYNYQAGGVMAGQQEFTVSLNEE